MRLLYLPFHYRARELFPRYGVVGLVVPLVLLVVVPGGFRLGVAVGLEVDAGELGLVGGVFPWGFGTVVPVAWLWRILLWFVWVAKKNWRS